MIKDVNINLIYPMVKATAPNELEAVLEEKDFLHPIILYRCTRYEWEQMQKNYPQILPPPNTGGSILQIRCGHNRVELAKRWGWETIPAVVYNDLDGATNECRVQHQWHKRKYGALV